MLLWHCPRHDGFSFGSGLFLPVAVAIQSIPSGENHFEITSKMASKRMLF